MGGEHHLLSVLFGHARGTRHGIRLQLRVLGMTSPFSRSRQRKFDSIAQSYGLSGAELFVLSISDEIPPLRPRQLEKYVVSVTRSSESPWSIAGPAARTAIASLKGKGMLQVVDQGLARRIRKLLPPSTLHVWTQDVYAHLGSIELTEAGARVADELRVALLGKRWYDGLVCRCEMHGGEVIVVGASRSKVEKFFSNEVLACENVTDVSPARRIGRWAARWYQVFEHGWAIHARKAR
jgi:hypothetical protein